MQNELLVCNGGSQGRGVYSRLPHICVSGLNTTVELCSVEQGSSTGWTLKVKSHSVAHSAKEPPRNSECKGSLGLSLAPLSQLTFLVFILISQSDLDTSELRPGMMSLGCYLWKGRLH